MQRQFIFILAICLPLTKGQTSPVDDTYRSVDPLRGLNWPGHGALPPGTAAAVPVHTPLVSNPGDRNYLLPGSCLPRLRQHHTWKFKK